MAWTDLPDGWNLLPLTHPALLNDVLDLVVGDLARSDGGLSLMLSDDGERLVTPLEIAPLSDVPEEASERAATLRPLLEGMAERFDDVTLLAAIGRRGGPPVTGVLGLLRCRTSARRPPRDGGRLSADPLEPARGLSDRGCAAPG